MGYPKTSKSLFNGKQAPDGGIAKDKLKSTMRVVDVGADQTGGGEPYMY